MLDIDGTITPYDYKAFPSKKVCEAIVKASEVLTVSLVTGRGYGSVKKIIKHIGLQSGFGAINNGSYVFDIQSSQTLYNQPIDNDSVYKILEVLNNNKIPVFTKQFQGDENLPYSPYTLGDNVDDTYMVFSDELFSHDTLVSLFDQLSVFSDITLHKTRHKDPNKYGFNITHAKATKAHAIEVILEQLKITKNEVISVGDSYNDFPLLMASGLKVAMGNALSDLKAIADYVAPSVDNDGVADVIEKYILKR